MGIRKMILCVIAVLAIIPHCSHSYSVQAPDRLHRPAIEAIYQFGDSLSDTGNLIRDNPIGAHSTFTRLPYGINFFHHPTDRCSDGMLMIDYIARFFRLPLLDPYLKRFGNFAHGVNFAVAGSTALDTSTLAAKNISQPVTSSSLSVQLQWFRSHLRSVCSTPADCKEKLGKALFMMGETGGNDFNYAILEGKSVEELHNMVPEVVQKIKDAVNEVIELGAVRIVVPGNFPIGCMPIYLSNFGTSDPTIFDDLQCIKEMNEFVKFQNEHLQQAISELQQQHPNITITYGDYFNGLLYVLCHASELGFDKDATHKACCGGGDNAYNFNMGRMCGNRGVQVCSNPASHVNWDGVHLTTHAYQHVARFLIKGMIRARITNST